MKYMRNMIMNVFAEKLALSERDVTAFYNIFTHKKEKQF